jgi:hypothetical protein
VTSSPAVMARARWRAAEDRLYPSLLNDPSAYQRGLAAVQAVLGELRRRGHDVSDLLELESRADELLATACPRGVPLPADLLVAVACGMRDRELSADREARRRDAAVDAARSAGRAWAVLDGPDDPAELTEGRWAAVHLDTGTVIEAAIDPWARAQAYGISVSAGEAASFADRDAWLSEIGRLQQGYEQQ